MTQEVSALTCRFRQVLGEVREGEAGGEYTAIVNGVAASDYTVSLNTVKNYEKGKSKKIPVEYIDAVCRAFNINHAYFFSPNAPKRPIEESVAGQKLMAMRAILDSKELSDPEILRVLGYVDGPNSQTGTE